MIRYLNNKACDWAVKHQLKYRHLARRIFTITADIELMLDDWQYGHFRCYGIRYTRNGGMRFLRIGRLQMSFCICKPEPWVMPEILDLNR